VTLKLVQSQVPKGEAPGAPIICGGTHFAPPGPGPPAQTTSPSNITVTALSGFTGAVTFSCSGLPSGASCVFTPATVQGSGNTALTIATTQAQDVRLPVLARSTPARRPWLIGLGSFSFAFAVLLFAPRRWRGTLWLSIVAIAGFGLAVTSCSGGSGTSGSTQQTTSPTTTTVTAATTSPARGKNDTFTATVTGGNLATGPVQFGMDGAPSGSPVTLNNGTAQFVTSFAIGGNHSVTASYSGDASHYGSSGVAAVTVPYTTGTLPGTYNVTITASSGALNHTSALTLTVN
jgi:hypothetical protein